MAYNNPLHQRDIPSTGYSSLSNAFQHPGQRQVALLAGVDSCPRILRPVAFTANGRPGIRVQDICSGHGYHYLDGPNDFVMAKNQCRQDQIVHCSKSLTVHETQSYLNSPLFSGLDMNVSTFTV